MHIPLIAVLILMMMSSCRRLDNDNWEEAMETRTIMVGGLVASKENPAVDVGLDFFHNLSVGTTYQDIVSEIGAPTGGRGSGIVRPFYAVDDVFVVMISPVMLKETLIALFR